MPANTAGLAAEAADDVWLNNYSIELMIWVDNIGQGSLIRSSVTPGSSISTSSSIRTAANIFSLCKATKKPE